MAKAWRDRGKERFWRRHVAAWRQSGRGIRDYCRRAGLSEPSFYAWRRVLAENVFSWPMWQGNFLGNLPRMGWRDRARVAGWWLVLLGLLAALAGPEQAALFGALWLAARATVFHLLTTFREISDHAGLRPGSLTGFARSHPERGALRWLIHPHNNGYHLAHHILPRVSCWRLPAAHRLLLACPEYAEGHLCDGYFCGRHPAVACWTGRCRTP